MLGLRIKSGPQPICLRHPLSEQSGNSKPIFPDDPNFVNKVEEACNPLSARVEGLLSQFSNLPNLLPHANPTVASGGRDANICFMKRIMQTQKDVSPCKARSSH